eukprot:CAMPEP_0201735464 /NCGR_PEP_ID=MMETSP0593-20130828/37142_1 /ASSEMBLY_ACC=CAM_ASM_000672 /TAXON_ID=267983 /ORGANISM="Skeletonema japonicum, Strain CCMP2506" /LENGTH=760 /DNA_ID=CAMNT_0048229019 /DNA_START=177 /DNA_END=2462 /DNA_ORIENTATION=-
MSRWLKNVNALLENLDNQVEETVEEHRFNRTLDATVDDDGEGGIVGDAISGEAQGVEDILAKRGLLSEEDDEIVDDTVVAGADDIDDTTAISDDKSDVTSNHGDKPQGDGVVEEADSPAVADGEEGEESKSDVKDENIDKERVSQSDDADVLDSSSGGVEESQTQPAEVLSKSTKKSGTENAKQQPPSAPSSSNIAVGAVAPNSNNSSTINAASMKELRKLRRHVLQLNGDLESSEREIEAQRQELDRAASRMERDRSRHKQEKESHDASHKAEIAALTAAHERALQQLKDSNETSMQEMEARVARAEQQRAKEGGERDAELADALERERSAITTASRLQEEKSMIDERIATLTTDISRLETRLEHATSQMELASERERNAEEQLDKALTLHAKQLGVRQKRESELEQTVADLGAALVVAKNKVEASMKAGITNTAEEIISSEGEDLKARLQDSEDEIETLRAQLSLERQRCSTLHSELRDLSKEQADELSSAHARQRQYERKISDLTTTVAKLESSRRSMRSNVNDSLEDIDLSDERYTSSTDLQHPGDEKKETDHLKKQIASLSEKIFEQQSKIDHSRAEISTMKNRLQAAVRRADAAEKSLEDANQRLIMMDTPSNAGVALSGMVSSTDEEMGTKPRRRRDPTRRGFQRKPQVESIRSALGLHHGRLPAGGCQEGMAQLLDTVDTISIDLGGHFRHSPISRLAFIAYLVILHMWAFFLIVYHAHAQGTIGGDHYGPESLMHSYRHMEQIPRGHPTNP